MISLGAVIYKLGALCQKPTEKPHKIIPQPGAKLKTNKMDHLYKLFDLL